MDDPLIEMIMKMKAMAERDELAVLSGFGLDSYEPKLRMCPRPKHITDLLHPIKVVVW